MTKGEEVRSTHPGSLVAQRVCGVAEEARVGEFEGLAELDRALLVLVLVLVLLWLQLTVPAHVLALHLFLLHLQLLLLPLLLAQGGFLVLLRRAGSMQQVHDVLEVQVVGDEG